MLEKEIFDLCSKTLKVLNEFKNDKTITQEEFETHAKLKLKFIKEFEANMKTNNKTKMSN